MLQRLIDMGNPATITLLRSPLHGLFSKSTMVITVTGRKSGKTYAVPVNYIRDGNVLSVLSRPERTWWRNLRAQSPGEGVPVKVLVEGKDLDGRAEVVSPDDPSIIPALQAYYQRIAKRTISAGEAAELARSRILVRIRLV